MNARGEINKPQEKEIADYEGPNQKSPPAAKTPFLDKEMAPPKTKHEPKPYSAPGKSAGNKAAESGFGDTGDKNLIYNPDTKKIPKQDNIEGQKTKNYPPNKKTKTEQFLDATKGMSIHEFTNHMITKRREGFDEYLPKISENQHPQEIIRYVSALANKNDSIMEDLVHALKRNGCFKKLIESLMDIPESLNMIIELLSNEDGARRCRQLVRCMEDSYTEAVGPPFGVSDKGPINGQPFDTVPDEDEEDTDDFATDEDEGEENDEDDEYEDDEYDDEGEGEEGEEGEDEDEYNKFPKFPIKKNKKKFAHDNILDAMGDYEHMRAKMRSY